jgi:SAM-dependent methyltransferase
MSEPTPNHDSVHAREVSAITIANYNRMAVAYCHGTANHDVSQNIAALLEAIKGEGPHVILDLGCGPGRDLCRFKALGHEAVGLDGSGEFVGIARTKTDCEVLHQDFLTLDLPFAHFDGIFANASLFHVPISQLARVLGDLAATLNPGGVLLCSNPRGHNEEGWADGRYGCFHDLETWRTYVTGAGFRELHHYYRPTGRPPAEQPWLVTVWRRSPEISPNNVPAYHVHRSDS